MCVWASLNTLLRRLWWAYANQQHDTGKQTHSSPHCKSPSIYKRVQGVWPMRAPFVVTTYCIEVGCSTLGMSFYEIATSSELLSYPVYHLSTIIAAQRKFYKDSGAFPQPLWEYLGMELWVKVAKLWITLNPAKFSRFRSFHTPIHVRLGLFYVGFGWDFRSKFGGRV